MKLYKKFEMKISFRIILGLSIVLIIFANNHLFAVENLSLKEIINQAIEKNYQIKILKNEEVKYENLNSFGIAGFYPFKFRWFEIVK